MANNLLLFDDSDPSNIPLEDLVKIKGAMWTARLAIPYGPRPNQSDNILAMDYYEWYGADDRRRMLEAYKSRGYTHAVTGPIIDSDGYHGQYPTYPGPLTQDHWDFYLDAMQEWWDNGIIPVHFAHPNNWSLDDMNQLIPFYKQDRAQRLLRVIVWTGWEPTRYDWSNAYWNEFINQGRAVMPNALHLVHTVADCDALAGGDDPPNMTNGERWQRSAPLLHGWLVQYGGYAADGQSFEEFKPNLINAIQDLGQRFREGKAGWPTGSLWGPDKPLKVYAGEYASYRDYWENAPEEEARLLGDAALGAGADGTLDGSH